MSLKEGGGRGVERCGYATWGVELGCTKICVFSDGRIGRRAVADVVLASRFNTLLRDGSRSERMCGVLRETIHLCCAKTRYDQ